AGEAGQDEGTTHGDAPCMARRGASRVRPRLWHWRYANGGPVMHAAGDGNRYIARFTPPPAPGGADDARLRGRVLGHGRGPEAAVDALPGDAGRLAARCFVAALAAGMGGGQHRAALAAAGALVAAPAAWRARHPDDGRVRLRAAHPAAGHGLFDLLRRPADDHGAVGAVPARACRPAALDRHLRRL